MLHSVNALRVIAEFWIVRLHLSFLVDPNAQEHGVWLDIFAHDLLSFFFVLSGFVAGHSHRDTPALGWAETRRYWLVRWSKTYPVYAVWVTVNLVGTLLRAGPPLDCSWFWPCVVGDYTLLSPWMFCESIEGPGVAWYLATLYWLWLAFPFIHSRAGWLRAYPWHCAAILWLLSLPPWTIGVLYPSVAGGGSPTNNLSRVPLFRLCEFLIGYCAAFGSARVSRSWLAAAGALFAAHYIMDAVLTAGYTVCPLLEGPSTCYLWGPRAPPSPSCIPFWDQYWSRTAPVWAVLVAYCADMEPRSEGGIPFLNHPVWRDLSLFSLQMYLGHFSVGAILVRLAHLLGAPGFWKIDTLLVACYLTNYGFYRCAQPVMDRAARRLCRLDSTDCSLATP